MKTLKNIYLDPIAKLLKQPARMLKTQAFDFARKKSEPGAAPGIENHKDIDEPPNPGEIPVTCIDYSLSECIEKKYDSIDDFLKSESSPASGNRWINVDGLNPYVVNKLREHYNLHTLAAEDTLHIPQRPKIENYDNHMFIVMRMLRLNNGRVINEQVSLFYLENTLITIQEAPGDIWDTIRKRMDKPNSRFRKLGNDYLLYALIDAIIDHTFPLLEDLGDLLEGIETQVSENPTPQLKQSIHQIRHELLTYRRIVTPTREMLHEIYQNKGEVFDELVTPFFGDVHDHARQLLDAIDSYREIANGLSELYNATVAEKLNETLKVLTTLASFFAPITFLAGVYGMNFKHIPELDWQYAYPVFWTICLAVAIGMWWYLRRKGWIGKN